MPNRIPRSEYHSAHLPEIRTEARARFEADDDSVALVHDISTGLLPSEFAVCDVFYSEPPWPRGMDTFNTRAQVDGVTFTAVMAGISAVLEADTRPAFIIMGKQGVRKLPSPDHQRPIQLNQWSALVNVYNTDDVPDVGTTIELMSRLATRYRQVGDFCCGYGRALRAFRKAGGQFIGSDYNPRCIGYIAEHAEEW